jgi:hypothetical protein
MVDRQRYQQNSFVGNVAWRSRLRRSHQSLDLGTTPHQICRTGDCPCTPACDHYSKLPWKSLEIYDVLCSRVGFKGRGVKLVSEFSQVFSRLWDDCRELWLIVKWAEFGPSLWERSGGILAIRCTFSKVCNQSISASHLRAGFSIFLLNSFHLHKAS